jgi:hypothetical protein
MIDEAASAQTLDLLCRIVMNGLTAWRSEPSAIFRKVFR